MRVFYDNESDILYIVFRDGDVNDTEEINEDVFIEFDKDRNIIGIEIWRASEIIIKPIINELKKKIEEIEKKEELNEVRT